MLITIVGVGALGSHLLPLLRNLDTDYRLLDFDRVEQKNLSSQFHVRPQVGALKVDGLRQVMALLWGIQSKRMTGYSSKMTSTNYRHLLKDSSLIVDCLDNAVSRRLVQSYVEETSTPCLHGALAADGGFGRVVWDENFVIDEEGQGGTPTCRDGEHLAFVSVVSSYLAMAVTEWVRQRKKIGFSITPAGCFSV